MFKVAPTEHDNIHLWARLGPRRIRLSGATYSVKDKLKKAGYTWNGSEWQKDFTTENEVYTEIARLAEEFDNLAVIWPKFPYKRERQPIARKLQELGGQYYIPAHFAHQYGAEDIIDRASNPCGLHPIPWDVYFR
ncbi:MAG: hypothetical protein H0Z24_03170 [Thermosipho sp. (in: Bacteria)]|nr:hypothetical protein [Thermosipho sp. (in: thermotogales)]